MRKTLLILAGVVLLYAAACSKKNGPSTDGPLPAPLQKMIAEDTTCSCSPYLERRLWKFKVIYMLGYTGPSCNWFPTYYNAAGELLAVPAGYNAVSFMTVTIPVKKVWSCEQK